MICALHAAAVIWRLLPMPLKHPEALLFIGIVFVALLVLFSIVTTLHACKTSDWSVASRYSSTCTSQALRLQRRHQGMLALLQIQQGLRGLVGLPWRDSMDWTESSGKLYWLNVIPACNAFHWRSQTGLQFVCHQTSQHQHDQGSRYWVRPSHHSTTPTDSS